MAAESVLSKGPVLRIITFYFFSLSYFVPYLLYSEFKTSICEQEIAGHYELKAIAAEYLC